MLAKIKFFILLILTIALTQSCSQKKKNVILFLVDDFGYHDLSSKGSNLYETPNIDKLVAQGIDFSNAYVSHPRCLPSRYGIQTSKFPGRSGIPGQAEVGVNMKNDITLGEAFQGNGYETFFAGKWHLGKVEKYWPQHRGYDINIAGGSAGAPKSYFWPYNKGTWVEDNGLKSNNKHKGHGYILGLEEGEKGEYLTDRLTDETIKFINKKHDKPFFAMLAHYGVHTPLEAKKELVEKYENKLKSMSFEGPEIIIKDGETKQHQDVAVYAAMIESVDESLGRLISALKKKGLYENTIIVFTSDHGGLSNRGVGNKRVLATSNLPLRAGKGHIYEGGIKVPFIIGGAITSKSHTSSQVTCNVDIRPTLIELCGLKQPKDDIDGISIAPYIYEDETIDRTLMWHSPRARGTSTGDDFCTVIREGDYKLFDFYKRGEVELYDLSKDPYESNNIAAENKELASKLKGKIDNWRTKYNTVK
ncbi:MAG: sulfatase [Flavobacteriales bacterium]|nr:sulfatase [Flavobacteriales bacterium]